MKICEVKEVLNAELLCGDELLENEVSYAFGSDLMSDVLAFVKGKTLLLTGLTNQQVVRTAEMADLSAIVFVRGKKPGEDIVQLATEKDIALLLTRDTMYTASGKLYSNGLEGVSID
ncbi:MAG TPA: DRTGG domain-containing protein [Bacillota bacterium]|mgnify:FL=1|nr:DRTGG domain-containing protein [Clostridiaceae bacterium]HNR03769.1 DRTGG domain-containing protein [Bacillota bacterium]HRU42654.1 DRTGG domain-containing protein [Candidatus Diapherotrites archaeon]HNT02352.1 DRTGG domain-containing protein [Bacillota bacterium]HNU79394.1 DRTGG domain-containing protein [Bacillota bacterium]